MSRLSEVIESVRQRQTKNEATLKESMKRRELAQKRIHEAETKILDLDQLHERLLALNESFDDLSNTRMLAERLHESVQQLLERINDVRDAEKQFDRERVLWDEAERNYRNAYDLFIQAQAGVLARDCLKKSEPCPVCGSVQHPDPATLPDHVPSRAALKEYENEMKKRRQSYSEAGNRMSGQKAYFESDLRECQAAFAASIENQGDLRLGQLCPATDFLTPTEYTGVTELLNASAEVIELDMFLAAENQLNGLAQHAGAYASQLRDKIREVQKARDEMQAREHTLLDYRDKLPLARHKLEEIDAAIREKQVEQSALKTEFELQVQKLNELKARLEFASVQEAKAAIALISTRLKKLEEDITANRKSLSDLALKMERSKTLRASYHKELMSVRRYDLHLLNQAQRRNQGFREENRSMLIKANTAVEQSRQDMRSIDALEETEKEQRKRLANLSALYDAYCRKPGLEAFVQWRHFEKLIGLANQRLREMSGGNLELVRRSGDDQASVKRDKVKSLALDVIDLHHGTVRAVETLSGGEAFIASLAMALSISDAVLAESGGNRLESVFIDEGFGSLDRASLDQVLDVLQSMSYEGRLVAIISHVETLAEKISQKILVEKRPDDGSRLKMICD